MPLPHPGTLARSECTPWFIEASLGPNCNAVDSHCDWPASKNSKRQVPVAEASRAEPCSVHLTWSSLFLLIFVLCWISLAMAEERKPKRKSFNPRSDSPRFGCRVMLILSATSPPLCGQLCGWRYRGHIWDFNILSSWYGLIHAVDYLTRWMTKFVTDVVR